jgi:hypothetical protein
MTEVMTDTWIADMVSAADGLGQFFVGVPEEEMVAVLYDMEADLENGLQPLGPDVAAYISETFCATVIKHRRELEAAGATSRVLN